MIEPTPAPFRGLNERAPSWASSALERPRVLVVGSALHVGGAENIMHSLSRGIDPARFEMSACHLKENGVVGDLMRRDGVTVHDLQGSAEAGLASLSCMRLRRLIRQQHIRIVHTHDVRGLSDASLCRLTVPRLRHVHTFHWGRYPTRAKTERRLERMLWRIPDRLVAVGYGQAAAIGECYGIPGQRLTVIQNGVAAPNPRVAPEILAHTSGAGVPVLMSVSTLTEQKGLQDLIEAAAILHKSGASFLLLIVGDGPMRPTLQRLTDAAGVSHSVRFIGWVPEAADRALPACDIFVQSSLWEAMSVVVMEAMAAGKPVVVTGVGDNERVVVHGRTGFVVPPRRPAELAQYIGQLLCNPTTRDSLGSAGLARHAGQYTAAMMLAAHENLYESLLA